MIHEIIDLGDTTAHEIMTPRADIMFVEDTETVKQALDRMRGTGYSRLPVFHEDYDRIVGVVKYKDLVPALMDDREDAQVGEFAHEAFFVPETKDIFPMLSEMQTSRQQMAIVVDEYGGTDGLITIEDIVEEIVGEIIDETDLESKYVTQLSDTEWLVDGSLPVEDAIELGWPLEESDDYETIAGWLIDMVDTIPRWATTSKSTDIASWCSPCAVTAYRLCACNACSRMCSRKRIFATTPSNPRATRKSMRLASACRVQEV